METMSHTTAQKVRMRLRVVISALSEKARSDARLKNHGGRSLTPTASPAEIREEYRSIVRSEFPGCVVVFQWGRIIVYPPPGYLEVRGSVGLPISAGLTKALFFGIE